MTTIAAKTTPNTVEFIQSMLKKLLGSDLHKHLPRVELPSMLLEKPDATVPLGTAPDGLPVVLSISRQKSILRSVLHAMGSNDIDHLSEDCRSLLLRLDGVVQQERRALGLLSRSDDPRDRVYVTSQQVDKLMGTPLAVQLLGDTSPLPLPGDGRSSHYGRSRDDLCVKTSAGVLMSADEVRRYQAMIDSQKHVLIPLDGTTPQVITRCGAGELLAPSMRPLVFEDLRAVPSAQYVAHIYDDKTEKTRSVRSSIQDVSTYEKVLSLAKSVYWDVTRSDVLRLVVQAARSIEQLQRDGWVHGDIKPSNILLTSDGAVLHDPLKVVAGEIAVAGTRGWNAPEQIIARPVTPAADVFALAQLVVCVLDAQIFGDERSFIVPVGSGQRIRENLLPDPDVFLDPNVLPFQDAAIADWRAFLRGCLALKPEERLPDAKTFADRLEELIDRHPIEERLTIDGLVGRKGLHLGLDGEPASVWVVHDSYCSALRSSWKLTDKGPLDGLFDH
jgi:serine/threonine protein kinase